MNITRAVSDVKTFRSVVSLRDRKALTGNFYKLYPVFHRWVNPSDIWRSTCEAFVRLQPMLAPPLTENNLRVRWFFVSLRQIEPELTPLIITGSNDGKLSEETLPEFTSVWDKTTISGNYKYRITANSIGHIFFNIPVREYNQTEINILNHSKASPRMYWLKALFRIIWDYYRDENLGFMVSPHNIDNGNMGDFDRFEDWFDAYVNPDSWDEDDDGFQRNYLSESCPSVLLKKDYFTSSSPWILKGVQPTIQFQIENPTMTWGGLTLGPGSTHSLENTFAFFSGSNNPDVNPQGLMAMSNRTPSAEEKSHLDENVQKFLNNIQIDTTGTLGFNMSDFRDLSAQTKVLERLARTGSRYTEYLRANFNVSPADETLQRAVYLGGFKQNILTNEVLQTAADGDNPVGTMRGHGITFAKNSMSPYLAKEFGMLFALADVRPNLVYTQGINREFTYASRYDFMNPSFQHLSEQAIRKGELYYAPDTDQNNKPRNDEVLGFTGMYNEMRTGKEVMCGEFGKSGSMSYWNQAISFASRPSLSIEFLDGKNYNADSQRPFGINDVESNPIIFDFVFKSTPARQLTKNPVPLP